MTDPQSATSTPSAQQSSDDSGTGSMGVPPTLKTAAGITWRVLVLLAGVAVLGIILGTIYIVVVALFLAAFFTALASPIMSFLQKRAHLHKAIAMILAIILIAVAVVVVLTIVVRSIISEGPQLASSFQDSMSELQKWASGPPLNLSDDDFQGYVTDVENWGKNFALDIGQSALGSVGDIVLGGSVFIFGVIFFMMAPQTIWGWVVSWMPTRSRPYVNTSGDLAWDSLSGYTRGVVIVALCDSILVFIGLLSLQVPMAPALAALVYAPPLVPLDLAARTGALAAPPILAAFFAMVARRALANEKGEPEGSP